MSEAGSGGRKLLIVGAHSGDFVWRAAGAIAAATSRGEEVRVVALSYGELGESGDLWNEPDQTIENVKRVRHEQAEEAARVIGASFECWDLGDYPLRVNEETLERLADDIREFEAGGRRWLRSLVSCSETLERGRTGIGLGRGIKVGDRAQPPLARLPGAHLHAEHRHQDALIARALEAVKGGPSTRQ